MPPLPSTSDTTLSKWYQSISELPLRLFKDALCDNRIEALIISGNPSTEELQTAWNNIIEAYAEAMGGADQKYYVQLLREVARAEATQQQITTLLETLYLYYAEPLANLLGQLLRTAVSLDPTNREQYENDLKRFTTRSKGLLINMQLKQQELQDLEAKMGGSGESPTRQYFDRILITLSDHAGFHLTDSITVFEYCERLNRFTRYAEQQKSK